MKLSGSILVCSVLLSSVLPSARGWARPIATSSGEASGGHLSVLKPGSAKYGAPPVFTPRSRKWHSHRKAPKQGAVKIERLPVKKSPTTLPVAAGTSAAGAR